jgi:hypothetical protein
VLVPQKATKEDDTQPSRPNGSLALLNKISQSRNSTWQLTNHVSCCGIQTVAPSPLILFPLLSVMGWDSSRQTHSVKDWTFKNSNSFLFNQQTVALKLFGPLSAAPSSAVSVGGVGQRLSELRGGLRSVQAARASFAGRPR